MEADNINQDQSFNSRMSFAFVTYVRTLESSAETISIGYSIVPKAIQKVRSLRRNLFFKT